MVDIIIPVYNAFEDLEICLKSLYENTNLEENRLIIIDDNSFDERIYPFLEEQKRKNILVFHNEQNRGFSANINIGLSQSDENDVILLNSDTVLTQHWVEKILKCAYSSDNIGTVTPLSNNATLCSIPEFCEENSLPDGLGLEETAQIVEAHSLKRYPRISVANGFCLFIKREVIRVIGNFDEATFQRGYGEENDFCNRAEQVGYINVMCDDTYIYHSGTKSFMSKEREEYCRQHDLILRQRYAKQMRGNDVFVRDNPNHVINENFKIWFDIGKSKKNILYVLHYDFRPECADNVGGTQFHVRDLVKGLREAYNIYVVARDAEYIQLTAYTKLQDYVYRFFVGENNIFPTIRDRQISIILEKILLTFQINIVHVHHTAGTSQDIFGICKSMGIPVYFTAHDFYSVCPNEKLLDYTWQLCEGQVNDERCKKCLNEQKGIAEQTNFMPNWRTVWHENFEVCEKIFTPSESAKQVLAAVYPDMADKICVIQHGIEIRKKDIEDITEMAEEVLFECFITKRQKHKFYYEIEGYIVMPIEMRCRERLRVVLRVGTNHNWVYIPANFRYTSIETMNINEKGYFCCFIPTEFDADDLKRIRIFACQNNRWYTNPNCIIEMNADKPKKKNCLRIAFIGGLNKPKGAEMAAEIIQGKGTGIEWYVFGGVGNEKLANTRQNNLLKTGYYNPEDLSVLLKVHRIDAICIFSLWAETYSYTLSEAITEGIPVIVSDIGALGERGAKYKGVYVLPLDTLKEGLYNLIDIWNKNDGELIKQGQAIKENEFPSIADMQEAYKEEYRKGGLGNKAEHGKYDNEFFWNAYLNSEEKSGLEKYQPGNNGGIEQLQMERIASLEKELNRIYTSISYRIVTKLLRMRIPYREKVKNFLRKRLKLER